MRKELQEKVTMFQTMNDVVLRGEIVVFGSSFMANFPFYELSQKYVMSNAVYNRSVEDLTLAEAEEYLGVCVLDIKPTKIFLALGEKDLRNPAALTIYNRILGKIKNKLPRSKIFLLPVQADEFTQDENVRGAFNQSLRALAERTETVFLDATPKATDKNPYEKMFKRLHCFFRNNRLNFADAFAYAD